LRPLALQATAAERAEKLALDIARLEARLAQLDLAAVEDRSREARERREEAQLVRRRVEERLEALLAERNRVEERLAEAAGRGEEATANLYRLRSASERLALRRESAEGLLERLRAERAEPKRRLDARVRAEREALTEQAR